MSKRIMKFTTMSFRTCYILPLMALSFLTLIHGEEDRIQTEFLYDSATFEEVIGSKDHFIKFFAPWCGHCKKLAPVWQQLSEKYNGAEEGLLTIAKVDCTEETKLCSDHGVTGYPTLKLYRPGQDPVKYKGKRDFDTLNKYVEDQLNPKEPEVPQPPEAKHGLYELTESNFKDHIAKGNHFVKFYAPWCGHCKRLAPTWEQLAQGFQHSDVVTIAKVDCTAHRSVCEQFGVKGYPTLKFFKQGQAVDSYKGGRDHVALKEYVSSMTDGGAEAMPPAQATPPAAPEEAGPGQGQVEDQASESKVLVLTMDTFQDEIATGLAFVKFYAPWCPHCKKLAPIWDQVAETFDKTQGLKVAKVDCTIEKELCKKHEIQGYPTLLLFNNGQLAEKHSGARAKDSLETYLRTKIPREEL